MKKILIGLFGFVTLVLAACTESPTQETNESDAPDTGETGEGGSSDQHLACVPGESSGCACEDGRSGAQVCNDDGMSFGECRCSASSTATGAGGGTVNPSSTTTSTTGAGTTPQMACAPGDSYQCACTNGSTSSQVCNDQGTGLEPCECMINTVCDANACPDGCCDANGICQPGTSDSSCGIGGEACDACDPGTGCSVQRACVYKGDCQNTTCAAGTHCAAIGGGVQCLPDDTAPTPPCNGNWEALPSLYQYDDGAGSASYEGGIDQYAYGSYSDTSGESRGLVATIDPVTRTITQLPVPDDFYEVSRMAKIGNDYALFGRTRDNAYRVVSLQTSLVIAHIEGSPIDMCSTTNGDLVVLDRPGGETVLRRFSWDGTDAGTISIHEMQIPLSLTCIGDSAFVTTAKYTCVSCALEDGRLFRITNGAVTELSLPDDASHAHSVTGPDPDHIYIAYDENFAEMDPEETHPHGHLAYSANGGSFEPIADVNIGATSLPDSLVMIDNVVGAVYYRFDESLGGGVNQGFSAFFSTDLDYTTQSLSPLTLPNGIWAYEGTIYAAGSSWSHGSWHTHTQDQIMMCNQQ